MRAPRKYVEELRADLNYYPTWFPQDRVALGEIGTFSGGVFKREAALEDLSIRFSTRRAPSKHSFKSSRGIRFSASAGTKGNLPGTASSLVVGVQAGASFSWAFGATGARKEEIDDLLQVQSAVLDARRTGVWKDEWLVVTEVYHVDQLSVLVANTSGARGEIRLNGTIPGVEDVLVSGEGTFHFDANEMLVVERARGTTPLFGLRRVRGLFTSALKPIASGAVDEEVALVPDNDASMFEDDG